MSNKKDGSFIVGFLLGFLTGLLGLIIALIIDKEETKSGIYTAFFVDLILTAIFAVCFYCKHFA